MSLKMAALYLNASLETFQPLCYCNTHRLQGVCAAPFTRELFRLVQVVMLSANRVLQNSPQFIVLGVEVWTPWGPILGADKCRNMPP
jgi:hypothetical protein